MQRSAQRRHTPLRVSRFVQYPLSDSQYFKTLELRVIQYDGITEGEPYVHRIRHQFRHWFQHRIP
jgi:hypothetical protein